MARKTTRKRRNVEHEHDENAPVSREWFVGKLGLVSPALADNDLIPSMTRYWFDGETLLAYNDHIAISTPCKTQFQGTVPAILRDLLKNSRTKQVVMSAKEDTLFCKGHKTTMNIKLALGPPSEFVFEMPEPKKASTFPVKPQDFFAGIRNCLLSVSNDTSMTEYLGVTVVPQDRTLELYSTDGNTMARSIVPLTGSSPLKDRIILPTGFCQQMLKMGVPDKLHLELHDDHVLFVADDVQLFGRLLHSERPLEFEELFEENFNEDDEKALVSIPGKLKLIVERAVIVTEHSIDQQPTHITVKEHVATFSSKSSRGDIRDSVQLGKGHPDAKMTIDARYLKKGYGAGFDRMLITDRCLAMAKEGMLYLIAAHG